MRRGWPATASARRAKPAARAGDGIAFEPASQSVLLGEAQLAREALGVERPLGIRAGLAETMCLQRKDGLDSLHVDAFEAPVVDLGQQAVAGVFDDQRPVGPPENPRHPDPRALIPGGGALVRHHAFRVIGLIEHQNDRIGAAWDHGLAGREAVEAPQRSMKAEAARCRHRPGKRGAR